jgi:hypothetical protein
MAEVKYCVALPFVATDDGVAAGEPIECFNPTAVVIRAGDFSWRLGRQTPDSDALTAPQSV